MAQLLKTGSTGGSHEPDPSINTAKASDAGPVAAVDVATSTACGPEEAFPGGQTGSAGGRGDVVLPLCAETR